MQTARTISRATEANPRPPATCPARGSSSTCRHSRQATS